MRYRESCQTATEVMLLQRPKKNLSQMEWSGVCTGSTSWSLFLRSGCSHSGWPWNGALLDHFFGHLKGVVQDCSTTERPLKRKQLLGPVFLWFWLARKQPVRWPGSSLFARCAHLDGHQVNGLGLLQDCSKSLVSSGLEVSVWFELSSLPFESWYKYLTRDIVRRKCSWN